ncbi:MAG: hypothetical protein ACRYFU_24340 [Janthinobacterium lividum]
MRLIKKLLISGIVALGGVLSGLVLAPAGAYGQEVLPPVGQINFFGYKGLDLHAVEKALPVAPGTVLRMEGLETTQHLIEQRIKSVTGHEPSNIDFVCCDANRRLLIYIGLAKSPSQANAVHPPPTGTRKLEPVALDLYDQDMEALMSAVKNGNSGEDDSQGFALSTDPVQRRVQLAMRAYALDRGPEFEAVLSDSVEAKQRLTAAALLGYARRSPDQIQALATAFLDADSEVRNNAVRALEVLTSAKDAPRVDVDIRPLAALLNSGIWSDRNKASLLLDQITLGRDPVMLQTLRGVAFGALVEGASWHGDPGHADAFVILLGRMADVPEDRILLMFRGAGLAKIIAKARNSHPN